MEVPSLSELEIPFVSWGLFLKKEVSGRKRELQISWIRAAGREEEEYFN
jgi:hypothetical protein